MNGTPSRLSEREIADISRLTGKLFRELPSDQRAAFSETTRDLMFSSSRWLPPLSESDENHLRTISRETRWFVFFVRNSGFAEKKDSRSAAAVFEDYIRFTALVRTPQGAPLFTDGLDGEKLNIRQLAYHLWEQLGEADRLDFLQATGQKAIESLLARPGALEAGDENDRRFLRALGERMRGDPGPTEPAPLNGCAEGLNGMI